MPTKNSQHVDDYPHHEVSAQAARETVAFTELEGMADSASPADKSQDSESGAGQNAGSGNLLAKAGQSHQESEFFSPIPEGYEKGKHKYVVVLGTVMSGLGKGIFSSSLAKLLKDKGLNVSPIKMEGYLNIDSGTLNPFRHGEVFVLDDGMETDMDLGTYERILDQDLTIDNFTTSGQIYRRILDKERMGRYLGRDVQMIPHVTGEVKYRLREMAMKQHADVVFVEVGGTAGDFENGIFIEAMRELAFEEGEQAVCFVALTYVIEPPALGEQKSKAAQLGLKKLMEVGIQPHIVVCRAANPVDDTARQKIAMFSNVPLKRVFSMHDRKSIYSVPDAMRDGGLDMQVLKILDLYDRIDPVAEDQSRELWRGFVRKVERERPYKINIALMGKYAALRDAYASIDKALEHASAHLAVDINLSWLDAIELGQDQSYAEMAKAMEGLHGVIVPGGFGIRGVETKIESVRYCRENKLPFLGICLGFQCAVLEYARHICGIKDAMSGEFMPNAENAVIDILPEQKKIEGLGGNMRLGGKDVLITPDTLAAYLFADESPENLLNKPFTVRRRFRHRFEVDPAFIDQLEGSGLIFSGRHPQQPIMQVMELPLSQHPFFIGGQFHPELTSRPLKPSPMFMGLVAAAIQRAYPDVPRHEISERWLAPTSANDQAKT